MTILTGLEVENRRLAKLGLATSKPVSYLDERHRKSVVNRAVKRIETLGYRVILEAA